MSNTMKYLTNPSKMLGLMGSLAIVLGACTIYNRYSSSTNIAADAAADAGSAYRNVKAAWFDEDIDGKIAEVKEAYAEEIAVLKAETADIIQDLKEELSALKDAAPQDSFTEAAKNKLNNTYKQAEDLASRYNMQWCANLIGGAAIAGLLLKVFYFTK